MQRVALLWSSVGLLWLTALAPRAAAEPIGITHYNITRAAASGTGEWAHTYTADVQEGGSLNGIRMVNYSGGLGTLADGVVGTSPLESQLFNNVTRPVIT